MGDAAHLFAAFTYIVPGMPLIYTGQLSGNHHRLEFFEKDLIDCVPDAPEFDMYKNLNTLRKQNKALWSPELGGKMQRIPTDNGKIFACARISEDRENVVLAFMNMSAEETMVTLDLKGVEGTYRSFSTGETKSLPATCTCTLKPYEVSIWTNRLED